jgi:hypothetical protein
MAQTVWQALSLAHQLLMLAVVAVAQIVHLALAVQAVVAMALRQVLPQQVRLTQVVVADPQLMLGAERLAAQALLLSVTLIFTQQPQQPQVHPQSQ